MSSRRMAAALTVLLVAACASMSDARQGARRPATLDGLRQFPGYYHLQNVLLRGEFAESDTRITFRAADSEMRAVLAEGVSATTGPVEIRAAMIDIGRLEPSDPRAAPFVADRDAERWPRPGEELVLSVTGVTTAEPAMRPTVRALALEPWRFVGQKVTVLGQFRGRNLLGDLPASPAKGRYDFVLRSADAAIWVTGLRPRGRGFELSVDARVDTGRWVEVSGTVAHERGLVMIDGTSIAEGKAPAATAETEETPAPALPPQPLDVVFSSPTPDETDVSAAGVIRVQFSRGVDPKTLDGQIRLTYAGAPSDAPTLPFEHTYDAATRAVQITPAAPFEPFRTVRVEFLGGIKAFDGGPFTPWTLAFSVGQ